MFIGHLPAGYLASTALLDRATVSPGSRRRLLALGLAASVAPDLDLVWFYLVSDRREVHHAFWPHLPAVWLLVALGTALGLAVARVSRAVWLGYALVGLNVGLHLVLDTTAGGVRWAWPASDAEFRLVTVPARYQPWYLNFVWHWTFGLELLLVAAAGWQFRRRRARRALVAASAGA